VEQRTESPLILEALELKSFRGFDDLVESPAWNPKKVTVSLLPYLLKRLQFLCCHTSLDDPLDRTRYCGKQYREEDIASSSGSQAYGPLLLH
jgi:hypothetical protein